MPTLAGFIAFAQNVMGISSGVLDPSSPYYGYALAAALAFVNPALASVCAPTVPGVTSWTIYELATYNLAGDRLINYAQDTPPSTYFATQRANFKINAFAPGVVAASSDEGSSTTLNVLDAMKGLTIGQLQNLKTPYGQEYLAIAQSVGSLWGIS